jgi:hypothetical protein
MLSRLKMSETTSEKADGWKTTTYGSSAKTIHQTTLSKTAPGPEYCA